MKQRTQIDDMAYERIRRDLKQRHPYREESKLGFDSGCYMESLYVLFWHETGRVIQKEIKVLTKNNY